MKIDMHVHTILEKPEPAMNREELFELAAGAGLDGFVITEHDFAMPEDEFKAYRENDLGLSVFRGVEIGCSDGFHYLVYGPLDFLPVPEEIKPRELVRLAHSCGNFVAVAHPYRPEDKIMPDYIYSLGLDGVEVKSFNLREPVAQEKSLELARTLGCGAIAGTDHHAHAPRVGRIGVELENSVNTEESLVKELKAGRFKRFDRVDF